MNALQKINIKTLQAFQSEKDLLLELRFCILYEIHQKSYIFYRFYLLFITKELNFFSRIPCINF